MFGYIYKTTNLINGKMYIGKHKASRFDIRYKGSGSILKRSFEKYGKENFKCEILEEVNGVPTKCNSLKELNSSEIFYIKHYKCVESDLYYNVANGGDGGDTWTNLSKDKQDQLICNISNYTKNTVWMYNSETHKQKRVMCNEVELYLSLGFELGYKYKKQPSKETYTKIAEKNTKIHLTDEQVDEIVNYYYCGHCMRECGEKFGLSTSYISKLFNRYNVIRRTNSESKKVQYQYHPVAQAVRNKMSNTRKGRPKSEDWKQKIRDGNRCKVVSESTKQKLHNHFSGRVWVTNGKEAHQILKEEINNYLANGFSLGRKIK